MKKSVVITVLILMISLQAHALQEYNTTPSFTITNMLLTGTPNIGDTLRLDVAFHSNIDQNFSLNLFFSNQIKPLNWQSSERMQTDTITLDSGVTNIKTYFLLVESSGFTNIRFSGMLRSYSTLFDNGNPKNILVKSGANPFIRTLDDDVDDNINSYTESLYPPWAEGNNTFILEGRCTYTDNTATNINEYLPKGAFNIVRLYFLESSTPTTLYHPVPIDSLGYIEGVHYAKCDANGYFHFNFSFLKSILNRQGLKLVLFVQKENEAIKLESPNEHHTILLTQGNYSMHTFANINELTVENFDGSHSYVNINDIININLEQPDGAVFRYATLSRMFVKERFNVDYCYLPFNTQYGRLAQINVFNKKNLSDAGVFTDVLPPNHKIEYRYGSVIPRTVIHEYGHYLDYAFNNSGGCGSPDNTEAFAMFYSTAVRSWINNTLGDEWNVEDNCEIAPYFFQKHYDSGNNLVFNERFGCLNKITLPYGGGRIMCRFAAYLYQIYDSKNDGNFMPHYFRFKTNEGESVEGLNNDDVDGLGFHFFNFWRQHPNLSYSVFNNDLKIVLAIFHFEIPSKKYMISWIMISIIILIL